MYQVPIRLITITPVANGSCVTLILYTYALYIHKIYARHTQYTLVLYIYIYSVYRQIFVFMDTAAAAVVISSDKLWESENWNFSIATPQLPPIHPPLNSTSTIYRTTTLTSHILTSHPAHLLTF